MISIESRGEIVISHPTCKIRMESDVKRSRELFVEGIKYFEKII